MSTVDASEHTSGSHPDQNRFTARIADETFVFRDFPFDEREVTGGQLAEKMRAHPVTDFIVLQQLETLELETLRPNEPADLAKSVRFFVIRGDAVYSFLVDGLSMVWPRKVIDGRSIKRLVDKEDGAFELLLEREDEPDLIIGDEDEVHLSDDGVEKFQTRPVKPKVTIIVEGTPHVWTKKTISYDEVVTLEVPDYPQHPEITYSVKYKNGVGERPEGVLVKGASVKVKNGMIFSVSPTGQS